MDLVTGGCGFIGSHLVESLENPLVVDKKKCRGAMVRDVLEPMGGLMEGVETLFHLAALPGVRYSVEHPREVAKVNIEGTLNLLEEVRKSDVETFLFASSSSVYGEAERPTPEGARREPKSPYAVSKLAGELYCKVYHELYGMRTLVVRPFTVYGPKMREDLAITIFARRMMEGKRPTVFGDGLQTRDFTYVGDVVEGMKLVAERGKGGETYNLGAGESHSVLEMIEKLNDILGTSIQPEFSEERKGDVEHTLADNAKLRELGWEPRTGFREGLERVVDWLRAGGSRSRSI